MGLDLKKFFKGIGDFFQGLFNAAQRTWNKLDPVIKDAMIKGSTIVEMLNTNMDKAPKFVIDLIQAKWPDFNIEKIKAIVAETARGLKIANEIEDESLEVMIGNLQKYLGTLKGKNGAIWAVISNSLANLFAVAIAPKGTAKVAAFIQLMEFVYQTFVKKRD